MNLWRCFPIARRAVLVVALTGVACGATGSDAGSVTDAGVADAAARVAAPVEAALQPGQRVQGTLVVDWGAGDVMYRPVATVIDADLGRKTAERLQTAEGQRDLDRAKERVGGGVRVGADDVQAIAEQFAGTTRYTSEIRAVSIIKMRQVTLNGTAVDGTQVTLTFSVGLTDATVRAAALDYTPDARRLTQSLTSTVDGGGPVTVEIDRFERVSDDTWSIAGRFTSGVLLPGVLARDLAGRRIEGVRGRFDVTEVHVRAGL